MYRPIAYDVVEEEGAEGYYWMELQCTNCDNEGNFAIKKGDVWKDYACSKCETVNLKNPNSF